ncbi:MAG TPA: S41 family peptidase, partial [Bacillota bacterium]|nr:S41 family peptidase [Bacillota bacterium]
MLEFAGLCDPDWIKEYRARVIAAPTTEAAFEIMDELVCRLNDYHTRLSWPGKPRLVSPPVRVEPVLAKGPLPADFGIWGQVRPPVKLPSLEGVAIALVETDKEGGLQVGDEILSVDGVPLHEALARAWCHAVGSSTAGKLRSACWRMLLGLPDSQLQIQVRRARPQGGDQTVTAAIPRSKSLPETLISSCEQEGVPVIRITRWTNESGQQLAARFDQLLARVREQPGLIIDVRGNGGGQDGLADQVTGRFLRRPIIASISFQRQVPSLTFERSVMMTEPRGPWRYEGRVAILTDEGSMSACEHFVSGMIEAGALACGTPTSGACGWIRTVELTGGLRLNVSRTFPLHTGGIPSPQLGIAPHLWAPRTLADLRAGEDTALRAALRWVKHPQPLPPRLQP